MLKNIAKFIGMMLGTAACGLALGFGLGFLLSRLLWDQFEGWGGLVGALAGMALGYPLGIIIALVVVKRALHYKGSLRLGALGAIIGAVLIFGLAEPFNLNVSPSVHWGSLLVLAPLLATIGYHQRLKRKGDERIRTAA